MNRILSNNRIAGDIYELVLEAPEIASKALPGHFVILMADEISERIPLTIADFDPARGTLTLVLMVVGTSTRKLAALSVGAGPFALAGPLGVPSEIKKYGTVVCVAGGVGTAPVYPIARALKAAGNRVICIQGARTKDLLFWAEKIASACDEHILVTDDGSFGTKGLVTGPLTSLLESGSEGTLARVWAIGPPPMMKACADTTKPYSVKTIVSLNTLMVDGTGMCGGCRVQVGGQTLFTCVQGPEFDGHEVNWNFFGSRQKMYYSLERCSNEISLKAAGAP